MHTLLAHLGMRYLLRPVGIIGLFVSFCICLCVFIWGVQLILSPSDVERTMGMVVSGGAICLYIILGISSLGLLWLSDWMGRAEASVKQKVDKWLETGAGYEFFHGLSTQIRQKTALILSRTKSSLRALLPGDKR